MKDDFPNEGFYNLPLKRLNSNAFSLKLDQFGFNLIQRRHQERLPALNKKMG